MTRLAEIHLDISEAKPSLNFYVDRLGMRLMAVEQLPGGEDTLYTLSFKTGACLKLRRRDKKEQRLQGYQPRAEDVYWKIGITVLDVDLAWKRLKASGIQVSDPQQFFDIGYLCHLDDPDGYCIELLQHKFQSNFKPRLPEESEPLGSRPNLGQVSLDVSSIENSLAFYRDQIGLNLLSHQPVPDRSFSLWFLGQEDLQPPSDAVEAIENREWLWALPETTLELRAFDNPQPLRRPHPPLSELGFRGIGFSRAGAVPNRLQDPDGVELWLS